MYFIKKPELCFEKMLSSLCILEIFKNNCKYIRYVVFSAQHFQILKSKKGVYKYPAP